MDWTDEARARLVREEERLRYKAANLQARGKTVMAAQELVVAADIRAALGEIERQKEKLQEWSDWEAMLHTQLERVVGGSGRGCDSLVETLRLRLLACEKEIDRKDNGYAAIIKMERDARDQFRERAEAAEAKLSEAEAEHPTGVCLERTLRAERDKLRRDLDRKDHEFAELKAEVARLTNKLNADSQNFEIECLCAEVERLKHLIFAWRQASYSGTPDEYQRAAVDLGDEALRIGVVRSEPKHFKHPTGDYCVYCLSQWPCAEAGEVK